MGIERPNRLDEFVEVNKMGDAADDAERRAEQEFEEEGVSTKLPTKAKEIEYEEVVAYGFVMGNIWENGLTIYSFGSEAEGEEWVKGNELKIEAIVPIRQIKKRIIQVPYNPDTEE